MERITTNVTYVSDGTEEDLKIFGSLVNSAQIDMNAREADRVMFTTPKTKYSNEGFTLMKNDKIIVLGATAFVLVFILLAFRRK
jgi:hypothetical protein